MGPRPGGRSPRRRHLARNRHTNCSTVLGHLGDSLDRRLRHQRGNVGAIPSNVEFTFPRRQNSVPQHLADESAASLQLVRGHLLDGRA